MCPVSWLAVAQGAAQAKGEVLARITIAIDGPDASARRRSQVGLPKDEIPTPSGHKSEAVRATYAKASAGRSGSRILWRM